MLTAALMLVASAQTPPAASTDARTATTCSDVALKAYASATTDTIDTIARAAVEECRDLWTKAADVAAGNRHGRELEEFEREFVEAAFPRYLARARPIADSLRNGADK